MEPLMVVERKVLPESLPCFPYGRIVLYVDLLILDGSPEALHEDVVSCSPASVLLITHLNALVYEQTREVPARTLDALVCVEDLGPTPMTQGLGQRFTTKLAVQRDRERPTQDIPTAPVYDRDQRDKALVQPDRGDIGAPAMIDPLDLDAA